MSEKPWYSQTWNFYNGKWVEGNPALIGPRTHSFWMASSVFDGGRFFEGVSPDLDTHCARVNRSALAVGLQPTMQPEEIVALAKEGAKKFGPDAAIYVKPMYWSERDGLFMVSPDPESTAFCLCLFEAPMPPVGNVNVITKSPFYRPTLDTMPTNAKTGALYPNNARMLREAHARGFNNALVLDKLGNVAETASANIFLVKDGVFRTPVANGTYLAGITRARMLKLLRDAGEQVEEAVLTYQDFLDADEAFTTGNYHKIGRVGRIDDVEYKTDKGYRRARQLYWDFAHSK
ncbi:MAG: branched-chain amino acid aminotransferase [Methylobacteriaceae bacterium]|nr:branched-chain amino acid aminotransferase [Methylobacteriaceae bacterium]